MPNYFKKAIGYANPFKMIESLARRPKDVLFSPPATIMDYYNKSRKVAPQVPVSPPPDSAAPASAPPPMRDFSRLTGGQLTPEELGREGNKILAQDRARFSGMNYPVYKGQTTSPMSTLTQRAHTLRNQFASRPRPYAEKINTVLGRDNQGISPQNIQGLLNTISQGQGAFGQNVLLPTLQNQFGNAYNPRAPQFTADTTRDVNEYLPEAQGELSNLARISSGLEGSRNQQTVKALQNLQRNKETRREALVGNLEQFGSQRHGYNNMVNSANRNQFNQEFNEPYRKMDMLEQSLNPYRGLGEGQEIHPDLQRSNAAQILQALKAYGIDTAKPVSEWGNTSNLHSSPQYQGQLVADLPPEITQSGDTLERLRSNLRDNNTDQRRGITRELIDNPNMSARAVQNLPGAMQGRLGQLEKQANQQMQRSLEAVNNKYIKLGQYGSPMHMREVEEASKRLNQAMTEQRSLETQNALKGQLQIGHGEEINKLNRLGQLGEQSHNDYADLLKRIRDMNELGAEKFKNNQGENERLYQNFQNERLWEWPQMRGAIRREGLAEGNAQGLQQGRGLGAQGARDEIFSGLATRGIGLDQLAKLNTDYDALNKVNTTLKQDLTSTQQAYNALQQQINAQRAQEQQKAQAERQRIDLEQNAEWARQQQAERERLNEIQAKWAAQSHMDPNRLRLMSPEAQIQQIAHIRKYYPTYDPNTGKY